MAYATASYSSYDSLLDGVRAHLEADGWLCNTQAYPAVLPDPDTGTTLRGYRLDASKGGFSTIIKTESQPSDTSPSNPRPRMYVMRGGSDPSSADLYSNGLFTNGTYHLFFSDNYIHIVLFDGTGVYKHFGTGNLKKRGTYNGGAYVFGSRWVYATASLTNVPTSTSHTIPFDTTAPADTNTASQVNVEGWKFCAAPSGLLRSGFRTSAGPHYKLFSNTPNTIDGRPMLIPLEIFAQMETGYFRPAGVVPDMAAVSLKNLNPGGTITIGAEQWKVFPVMQKTETWSVSGSTIPSSGHLGFAYKVS